jgi:hypothetical protein
MTVGALKGQQGEEMIEGVKMGSVHLLSLGSTTDVCSGPYYFFSKREVT